MCLNNINFLSLLIIIVFIYLIYNVYQINNTQTENFRKKKKKKNKKKKKKKKKKRGGFFSKIVKKVKKTVKNKVLKPISRRILSPVGNFFNIKKRLREAEERREAERRAAAARKEAARKLAVDETRKKYQTELENKNKEINETSIFNLSKSSQSAVKSINNSKRIANQTYIQAQKDDVLTNYMNIILE